MLCRNQLKELSINWIEIGSWKLPQTIQHQTRSGTPPVVIISEDGSHFVSILITNTKITRPIREEIGLKNKQAICEA